jgi:uncharacterized membrane protein
MNMPYNPSSNNAPDNQTMAIVVLVLAIGSWVGLSLLGAIPAMILARIELKKIDRHEVTDKHRGLLQVGFWVSAVHVILGVIGILFFCVFQLLLVLGLMGTAALSNAG